MIRLTADVTLSASDLRETLLRSKRTVQLSIAPGSLALSCPVQSAVVPNRLSAPILALLFSLARGARLFFSSFE